MSASASSAEPLSRFSQGRPKYHVVAQRGWMNDPCAPGYDSATGTFHLMYQWNPYSHVWDHIAWGGVESRDLVKWTYTSDSEIFKPDQPYDEEGIFTGCMVPTALDGSAGGLSIFYTSVPRIPIHWSKEHDRGQEGVAVATSSDGGKTWIKAACNPVVEAEPAHLYVTGFRDPSVVPWPEMDVARSLAPGSRLYGLLAGGVRSGGVPGRDEGPRLFLYEVDRGDMTQWTFLQTLGNSIPRNYIPERKWAGDFGTNWECATVFSLRDETTGVQRSVGLLGVEGALARPHVEEYRQSHPGRHERTPRFYHWFIIDDIKPDQLDMAWRTTGLVDWADLYAISTFAHPDGRRIAWGWVVDQDLEDSLAEEKGSTGCLGIPREMRLRVYDGVVGTSGTRLEDIIGFQVEDAPTAIDRGDGKRVITVGSEPLSELEALRIGSLHAETGIKGLKRILESAPECYELRLTARVGQACRSVGLAIRESADGTIGSVIEFVPREETLAVRRDKSTTEAGVCTQDEIAPFTLLQFGAEGAREQWEELELRVFVDGDVVEVFANGRVSFATRLFSPREATGVSVVIDGEAEVGVEVWEMGSIGLVQ